MNLKNPTGVCRNCKTKVEAYIQMHFFENGSIHFSLKCQKCESIDPFRTGQYISERQIREEFTIEEIEAFPKFASFAYSRCVRCGKRGAELHHWAPKEIFGQSQAETWPKDYLCRGCHQIWHEAINRNRATS